MIRFGSSDDRPLVRRIRLLEHLLRRRRQRSNRSSISAPALPTRAHSRIDPYRPLQHFDRFLIRLGIVRLGYAAQIEVIRLLVLRPRSRRLHRAPRASQNRQQSLLYLRAQLVLQPDQVVHLGRRPWSATAAGRSERQSPPASPINWSPCLRNDPAAAAPPAVPAQLFSDPDPAPHTSA